MFNVFKKLKTLEKHPLTIGYAFFKMHVKCMPVHLDFVKCMSGTFNICQCMSGTSLNPRI